MILINVTEGIEKALKKYKSKLRNIKQNVEIRDRKEFTKKSVSKRRKKLKAIYINMLNNKNEE